jgi:hypothetical protein
LRRFTNGLTRAGGIDKLRRDWPPAQQRQRVWNRDIFARASGTRKAYLLGWNHYTYLPY